MSITCIKTSLKAITDNKYSRYIINDTVFTCHKIIIIAYQFIELYMIYCYDNKMTLPIVDQNFVLLIVKIITFNENKSGPKFKNIKLLKNLST